MIAQLGVVEMASGLFKKLHKTPERLDHSSIQLLERS